MTRLPSRIVAFCLPGIGDALLFTPALGVLRRTFPDARITAVTMFPGAADILRTNPDVDEVRFFDFMNASTWQAIREVWRLRREQFDLSILSFPSNRIEYNAVSRLVGRRWRAAHRYQRQRWRNLCFLNNVVVEEDEARHNLEENLRLVDAACRRIGAPVTPADPRPRLHLTPDDVRRAEAFLAAQGIAADDLLIGLHTYSSTHKNMHRKCWDKDDFVALVERMGTDHPGARFLLFSGPSDVAVNEHIVRRTDRRVVLVEQPNLRWALGALRRCRLFVSNDSAIMHLAAALDVPVVALFGPTDWRRLHPWAAPHQVVRRHLPCMPCFRYSSRPLRCDAHLDFACMRELGVDDVLEATRILLADTGTRPSSTRR